MKYVDVVCVCCGGKWRARVALPDGQKFRRRTRYLVPWSFQVICGRCNNQDCGGDYRDGKIVPCLMGRVA